ncbi:Streptopain precursor [compost metagenome]
MKRHFILGAVMFLISSMLHAQNTVSYTTAKEAAIKWMSAKGFTRTVDEARSYDNLDVFTGEQINLYVIQFNEGGFAIVPSTKLVLPVLAYNSQYSNDKELLKDGSLYFIESYDKAIAIHKSVGNTMEGATSQWNNLLQSATISCPGQSTLYPSLLEHYQTSRWAGWDPIYNCATSLHQQITPNPSTAEIGGNCVPTGLSQICRFYRHPFVGTGTGSHTMQIGYAIGQTNTSNFSTQAFDYDLMPYKVNEQGPADGLPNDQYSWDPLYPICGNELNEIGHLNWNLGVACRMNWYSPGTSGNTSNWANDLVDHFGYTWNQATDYVQSSNPSVFKAAIRSSLMNERPVLCAGFNNGGGHFFLYTGFECDNYFYASVGLGGNGDGFFYIFSADASGNYLGTSYPNSQNCATNVRPLCNYPAYYQVPGVTYANGTVHDEQALIDLTVSGTGNSVIVSNGAESFMIGGNTVELLPGMEVQLGGKLHVLIENCNGPED